MIVVAIGQSYLPRSVRKILVIEIKNGKNLIPSENVKTGVGATNALKKTNTV